MPELPVRTPPEGHAHFLPKELTSLQLLSLGEKVESLPAPELRSFFRAVRTCWWYLLTASSLLWFTWVLSLRDAAYHCWRPITGLSATVGISWMIKWCSASFPSSSDTLLDLLAVIFFLAHLMLSCSLPSSHLMQAFAVVRRVRLSMYALIGGSRRPCYVLSDATTHWEAPAMTSITTVKVNGEMVQPTTTSTSRRCHVGVYTFLELNFCSLSEVKQLK